MAKDSYLEVLVRALVISLVLHLIGFGTWKYGQAHGWWREAHLPNWFKRANNEVVKKLAKTEPDKPKEPKQITLTFVDVDPTMSVAEPPKDAKYTSSANTIASSPKKTNSELPDLNGKQQKVLKTTENAKAEPKAQPLQPTPKPLPQRPKPMPPPQSYTPGSLVMAKPSTNLLESKSSEPEAQPRRRPRTVAEAKAMRGIAGEKMQHEGGGPHVGLQSSLDVKRTITGDYDRMFVDAVQARWDSLLQEHPATLVGEVKLEFKMHYDGRITDVKMTHNTVDQFLALLCQKAILDNVPYPPWSRDMRRELSGDTRDVTFTFYYE